VRSPDAGSVGRVLVFPMSGYINRLQALASSLILAEDLGADFSFCWIPFRYVPGPATDTLGAGFCDRYELAPEWSVEHYSIDVDTVPRYVTRSPDGRWIGLRGHDRGEQALVPELEAAIRAQGHVELVVAVAGGTFRLDTSQAGSERFLERKRDFYRALPLHEGIESTVRDVLAEQPGPYLGLHLRYTDRGHQAPLPRDIRAALVTAADRTGLARVFVASDTARHRDRWHDEVRSLGLEPWSIDHPVLDREDPASAHAALIDWRLLGHARRLVYFAESSYATEAAVAAGAWSTSVALRPHRGRAAAVQVRDLASAAWFKVTGSRPT